jgi:outer membrane protein assembly factor BamE (lipoprotein component of BamABCDE complex)
VRLALAAVAVLTLIACTAQYRNHGYAPTDEELQAVKVGVSTRDSVVEAVGRPAAGGLLTDSAWYYVQSRWRHYGARAPQEIERQVLAVSFDSRGTVENIERFGLEDGRVVPLSRRVTDTNVRGLSVIRQLLGNLGNFDPGQFLRQQTQN